MKFRTDFVTNSSSSSYTTVSVHLQEGNSLGCFWEDWTAALADDFLLFQKGEISVKTMAVCFAFGSSEELFYSIEEADWQTPQELDEALAALSEERLQTILQERACQEDYEAFLAAVHSPADISKVEILLEQGNFGSELNFDEEQWDFPVGSSGENVTADGSRETILIDFASGEMSQKNLALLSLSDGITLEKEV